MTHKMKRDVPTQCVIGIIIQLFIFMGAAWAMEGNLPDRVSRSTLSAPVGMNGRAFQQAYNKFFSWKTARELLDNIHDQQAGVSNTLLRELGQIENRGEIIREMAGYPHIESILSIPHLKENNRVMGKVCVLSNAPRTKKITVLISYPGRYGGVFPGKVSPKHVIMGDSGVSLVLARKGINEGAVYHISATGKKTETVVFPANAAFLNLNITHGGITTVELTRKVKLGGARAVQLYTQYYITPEGMVIKVNDESTQFPLAAAIDDINGMATYVIKDNDGLYAVCHISKQGKKKIVVTGSRYEPKVEWRPGGSMIVTAQDVVDVGGRMFNSYAVYHISPASVIKKVAGTIYPFPDEPGMKPQIIMNDRGGVVVLTPLKNFGRITYKLDYVNVKGETVRTFNSDAKPRIKLSEEGALLLAVPHSLKNHGAAIYNLHYVTVQGDGIIVNDDPVALGAWGFGCHGEAVVELDGIVYRIQSNGAKVIRNSEVKQSNNGVALWRIFEGIRSDNKAVYTVYHKTAQGDLTQINAEAEPIPGWVISSGGEAFVRAEDRTGKDILYSINSSGKKVEVNQSMPELFPKLLQHLFPDERYITSLPVVNSKTAAQSVETAI